MSESTKDEQQHKSEEDIEEQAVAQQGNEQDSNESPNVNTVEQNSTNDGQEGEPDNSSAPSVEELLQKLEEAEQKKEENYQKLLRAQADFDNFRRRSRTEREEQAKYAALPLLEKLLPVIDNFERALAAGKDATDVASIVQGVEMVFRQVEQALQDVGLEMIPTVGEAFDPNVHQAVMQEESAEHEAGIVLEELQKGYKLKDRVIRPAMVKVSS